MFTPKIAFTALLCVAGSMAYAQSDTTAARTVAALPEPVGDLAEPTPPSPRIDTPETDTVPGTDKGFGIGQPATEDEIAAIDIDVMPDGSGLPAGSGTYAQGEQIYAEKCASCHGDALEGIKETGAPALVGGSGTLNTDKPMKTVESYWPYASTLFDYVYRAMPLTEPGSLTPDEVYALSAYILGKGGILGEDAALDQDSFRKVVMPNADGFVEDPRPGTL